jgi:hypothetical protein
MIIGEYEITLAEIFIAGIGSCLVCLAIFGIDYMVRRFL